MNDVKATHPLRLVLTGIQPFIYCWALVAVLGIMMYVLNAGAPSLGEMTWRDAGSVTTGWWLTSLGARLHVSGVTVSLPPLMLTVANFMAAWLLIRRVPVAGAKDVAILAGSGAVTVGLISMLAPIGSMTWPAILGAIAIIVGACLLSKNRDDWFSTGPFQTLSGRIAYDCLMMTRKIVVVSIIVASAVFLISSILAWSEIARIGDFYILSVLSTIMLWLFQLAYLPNFIIWTLFFLIGSGFHIGDGTNFSSLDVTAAPLPAVPLLGALPQPGGTYWWLLVVLIAIMIGYGAFITRSFPTLREALVTAGIQIATTAFVFALIAAVSTGSIGPERMAFVGATPPVVALGALLALGLPFFIGVVAFHHTSRAAYKVWFAAARSQASKQTEQVKEKVAERRAERAEAKANQSTEPESDDAAHSASTPDDSSASPVSADTAPEVAPTAVTAPATTAPTSRSAATPEETS